jgi:hypothetical protein
MDGDVFHGADGGHFGSGQQSLAEDTVRYQNASMRARIETGGWADILQDEPSRSCDRIHLVRVRCFGHSLDPEFLG